MGDWGGTGLEVAQSPAHSCPGSSSGLRTPPELWSREDLCWNAVMGFPKPPPLPWSGHAIYDSCLLHTGPHRTHSDGLPEAAHSGEQL